MTRQEFLFFFVLRKHFHINLSAKKAQNKTTYTHMIYIDDDVLFFQHISKNISLLLTLYYFSEKRSFSLSKEFSIRIKAKYKTSFFHIFFLQSCFMFFCLVFFCFIVEFFSAALSILYYVVFCVLYLFVISKL